MDTSDKYEFLNSKIGNTVHVCNTLNGRIGEHVILYGISGHIVPTGHNTGLLFLGEDKMLPGSTGDDRVIYVEIDKENPLSKAIEDGRLDLLYGFSTYVYGIIKDLRNSGNRTEFLIHR